MYLSLGERLSDGDLVDPYDQLERQNRIRGKQKGIMQFILLLLLVLLLVGALPAWPYSSGWGYYPSGGLGLILVVALLVILLR